MQRILFKLLEKVPNLVFKALEIFTQYNSNVVGKICIVCKP